MTKAPWWVVASLAATGIACLPALYLRVKAEASNKAVGLMMEVQSVNELAASSGVPIDLVLSQLKERGLTGVAVTEETVADLAERGDITLGPRAEGGVGIVGNPEGIARTARAIARRGGLGSEPQGAPDGVLIFDGDVKILKSSSAGLNPSQSKAIVDAGLMLVARHMNAVGAGPTYVRDILEQSKTMGATAYLAAGEQVLGQRSSVEDTAVTLQDLKMTYLTPEFTKIAGDTTLATFMPESVVRLHSMQQAEIDKTDPRAVVERYSKAFRERNIRWLLVRPLSLGGQDATASMASFLSTLANAVAKEGGAVKVPRPFTDPGVPTGVATLILFLAAPWVFWSVSALFGRIGLWIGIAAALAVAAAGNLSPLLHPAVLLIGVMAPVAGFQLYLRGQVGSSPWISFGALSLVSLVGGLVTAALLSSLPYLIQLKQPMGVKAVLLGPIVIVAALIVASQNDFKQSIREPVRWATALTGLVVLGSVAFLVVRSGNDAPGAVSELELKARAVLDTLLYTRPRTKDILVGHPALLVGLLLNQGRAVPQGWAALALVVGAIGQADIVNTLCHSHTPLDIGLARIVIGLVVGGIIGAVAWWVGRSLAPKANEGG